MMAIPLWQVVVVAGRRTGKTAGEDYKRNSPVFLACPRLCELRRIRRSFRFCSLAVAAYRATRQPGPCLYFTVNVDVALKRWYLL